ncbi:MAG TPA: alpha-xylosidase [Capsulimonadaceae bacterium]|jgi:alpha-D-xyloside xylohydrolase
MKFTDGNWMHGAGVRPHYAAHAYSASVSDAQLSIVAPCQYVGHRTSTIGGTIIDVALSSPAPDVINVRISKDFVDSCGPQYQLNVDPSVRIETHTDDHSASISSGQLSAIVRLADSWQLDFVAGGRTLTSSKGRSLGMPEVEGQWYCHEQLSLGVGETVYGFGERFTAFVKNGQVVESWNKDGGTGSDQAYKAVPFYMTSGGYGVFVREPGAVSFEVASEKVSRVQFSTPGKSLEYCVIYGPTPKEILAKYTLLTGRPALPPAWSFGLWLTTSFTTDYDETTVSNVIDELERRNLPLHVFHFDCFWMREFQWCDFEWDARVFPDPKAMLARLKSKGLRISVWINPYIAFRSKLFAEAARQGFLLKKVNGEVWQTDEWQPGMGIVDFTNPKACEWYAGKLAALVDMGVDCFKTDFGERIPLDVVYHDGSRPDRMHNYYSYLYNKNVFDLLKSRCGNDNAVLFARSATAGGQQFPIHWGGDCSATFESMAESLRGGLSLGISGFGFWSHDIGGFEGSPDPAVYKRWIAFGLLSSHSRLHGNNSYRVPWLYDEEAVDVLRRFTQLKCELMPYIFAAAMEARAFGVPVMRAMFLEFPDDPACRYLDRQYMLGPSLLVAPVMSDSGKLEYYIPEGTWTDFETGRRIVGPQWVAGQYDYFGLPLYARCNSAIAVGNRSDVPDYDYASGVTVHAFELSDGNAASVAVPSSNGASSLQVTVMRSGSLFTITGSPAMPFEVLLRGVVNCTVVEGGRGWQTDLGFMVRVADGSAVVLMAKAENLNNGNGRIHEVVLSAGA